MPFQLQETVDDFNNKYNGAIGLLKVKGAKAFPISFAGVTRDTMTYYSLSKFDDTWNAGEYRLNNIEDLQFTFPYLGQVWRRGYIPVYVDRAMVRSTHRGWSNNSIKFGRHPFLDQRYLGNKFKAMPSRAADPLIVRTVFNGEYEFLSLSDLLNEEAITAALSSTFAVVKCGKYKWLLIYGRMALGHIEFDDNGEYTLNLPKSIEGIRDMFYQQVKE